MRLEGKVCIITGAGSGIGKTAAELFAEEGAIVIAFDVAESTYEQPNIHFYKLDVTDRTRIGDVVKDVVDKFGKIDVLVNNAGITRDALIQNMTEEDWDKVINVNLKGVFNMTQAVVPYMLEAGKGSIINTSSVVGVYGNIGQTNYSAAKAGVIGMTKTWAKEFARKGAQIRVNAVAPGFIKTPMTEKVPEKILTAMSEKAALKRLGEPTEVAYLYLFLASDESSYITGQVIGVDGGLIL
ncbi:MAG: beta-ketoacyl-ACP reductase [Fervidobacterium sp.]